MVNRGCKVGVTVVFGLMACFLWDCGLDETYTGMGEGALPGDPLRPNNPEVVVDCGCPPCNGQPADVGETDYGQLIIDDLTGTGYRFDRLTLSAPLTGFVGSSLNDYFEEQISDGLLHVLLSVVGDDRDSGDLTMLVGAGEVAGEGYRFGDEASDLLCTLTGRYFVTVEPASLVFPNDLLDPPTLPIQFLSLSGWISADGTAISDGVLVGALTEEDAAGITIMGSDFVTFFATMGIPMDLDTNEDSINDAWQFVGAYSASQIDLVEE